MLQKLLDTLCENKLIEKQDRLVVGVSGGPDSMCLLSLLLELAPQLRLSVFAAHVNHKLRGVQADEDADFVRGFCTSRRIPFFCREADVKELAVAHKTSVEDAGRKIRYDFFQEVLRETGANKIVTAHHRGDQAETVLMRLIRGTSLDGLAGILERRQDGVIRPLLRFSKQEILEYLEQKQIPYRIDATNQEDVATRNRIRNRLMTDIREMNPEFDAAAARLALFAGQDSDFIRPFVKEAAQKYTKRAGEDTILISVMLFDACAPAVYSRVVHGALLDFGVQAGMSMVEDLISLAKSKKNGCEVSVSGDLFCALEYDRIAIYKKRRELPFHDILPIGESVVVQEAGMEFCAFCAKPEEVLPGQDQILLALPSPATSVTIRSRQGGDAYQPAGFSGHCKLKEWMIDKKIPRRLRGRIPVLEACGEIAWVYGGRVSQRFLADGSAKEVVVVRYRFLENDRELQDVFDGERPRSTGGKNNGKRY